LRETLENEVMPFDFAELRLKLERAVAGAPE
jgi:hypothetical protein